MNKKILIFNDYYPIVNGGAEYQAWVLAQVFKDANYQVVFVSLQFEKNQTFVDEHDYKVYGFVNPNSILSKASLYYFYAKKLTEVIELEQPVFVYQRVLNSFSFYIAESCYKRGIPFFLHIADNYSLKFNGSWRAIPRKILFDKLLKYPVEFACQTVLQQRKLECFGREAKVLPNLLPIKGFQSSLRASTIFRVLWIANIRPVKQIELFLSLAKMFSSHEHIEFHIIGRKDEAPAGFDDRVNAIKGLTYLGELTTDEVLSALSNANVLVNTSLSEGFSNTFIQAWANGVPVLSLNSDPNDWISEYDAGVFAKGHLDDLSKALQVYLESPEKYQNDCLNARRLFNNHFDFEKNKVFVMDYFTSKLNHVTDRA